VRRYVSLSHLCLFFCLGGVGPEKKDLLSLLWLGRLLPPLKSSSPLEKRLAVEHTLLSGGVVSIREKEISPRKASSHSHVFGSSYIKERSGCVRSLPSPRSCCRGDTIEEGIKDPVLDHIDEAACCGVDFAAFPGQWSVLKMAQTIPRKRVQLISRAYLPSGHRLWRFSAIALAPELTLGVIDFHFGIQSIEFFDPAVSLHDRLRISAVSQPSAKRVFRWRGWRWYKTEGKMAWRSSRRGA
jgi:hypothetical protein